MPSFRVRFRGLALQAALFCFVRPIIDHNSFLQVLHLPAGYRSQFLRHGHTLLTSCWAWHGPAQSAHVPGRQPLWRGRCWYLRLPPSPAPISIRWDSARSGQLASEIVGEVSFYWVSKVRTLGGQYEEDMGKYRQFLSFSAFYLWMDCTCTGTAVYVLTRVRVDYVTSFLLRDRYRPFPSLAIVTMCMGQGPNSASLSWTRVREMNGHACHLLWLTWSGRLVYLYDGSRYCHLPSLKFLWRMHQNYPTLHPGVLQQRHPMASWQLPKLAIGQMHYSSSPFLHPPEEQRENIKFYV